MSGNRDLEQTPSLVDRNLTDDVGNPRTAKVVEAIGGTGEGGSDIVNPTRRRHGTQVKQIALMVGGRIDKRRSGRDAVTELSGVGQLVDGGDVAAAADETVEVVARIIGPRSIERGCVLPIVNPANWMNAW